MALAVHCSSNTGRSFGGGPASLVGRHLTARRADFGSAITEIDIAVWYHWQHLLEWEEEENFAEMHDAHRRRIRSLPSRRFERKHSVLRIDWDSGAPRELVEPNGRRVHSTSITPEIFDAVFDQIMDAIRFGLGILKPSDSFDPEGMLAWMNSIRVEDRGDAETLRTILNADIETEKAIDQARDPWERLDLDWDRFASNARAILDDPADWSSTDDFSPHGNDTGADILAAWADYVHDTPMAALNRLFGEEILKMPPDPTDEHNWWLWVEVHLALAFGHIKTVGMCPPDISRETLAVIGKEQASATTRDGWRHRDAWLVRLNRYSEILRAQLIV